MIEGVSIIEHVEQFCNGCALGKQHRSPFPQATTYRAERRLELVHSYFCGPITTTPGGNHYFLLIVNDHSMYMRLEVLRSKDEAFKFFKKMKVMADNELDVKLKAFCSDHGDEFNSIEFGDYCDELGINRYTTAPYSSQQNGVIEW